MPEGLSHDAFGDIVMCTELLNTYAQMFARYLADEEDETPRRRRDVKENASTSALALASGLSCLAGLCGLSSLSGSGVRLPPGANVPMLAPDACSVKRIRSWLSLDACMHALVSQDPPWVDYLAALFEPILKLLLRDDEQFQVSFFLLIYSSLFPLIFYLT